jgi:hypothetical protein
MEQSLGSGYYHLETCPAPLDELENPIIVYLEIYENLIQVSHNGISRYIRSPSGINSREAASGTSWRYSTLRLRTLSALHSIQDLKRRQMTVPGGGISTSGP